MKEEVIILMSLAVIFLSIPAGLILKSENGRNAMWGILKIFIFITFLCFMFYQLHFLMQKGRYVEWSRPGIYGTEKFVLDSCTGKIDRKN